MSVIKTIYFVDCENVGTNNFIPDDTDNSIIYYFISKLDFEVEHKADYEFYIQRSHTGCKDAMDFILDTWLGYCINKWGRSCEYCIVSNDNGFQNIKDFWESYGYSIKLYKTTQYKREDSIVDFLSFHLPNKPKYIDKILNIYSYSWSPNKSKAKLYQQLYRCLKDVTSYKKINIICEYLYSRCKYNGGI